MENKERIKEIKTEINIINQSLELRPFDFDNMNSILRIKDKLIYELGKLEPQSSIKYSQIFDEIDISRITFYKVLDNNIYQIKHGKYVEFMVNGCNILSLEAPHKKGILEIFHITQDSPSIWHEDLIEKIDSKNYDDEFYLLLSEHLNIRVKDDDGDEYLSYKIVWDQKEIKKFQSRKKYTETREKIKSLQEYADKCLDEHVAYDDWRIKELR